MEPKKSFAEAVANSNIKNISIHGSIEDVESIPLKPTPTPRIVGGNAVVEVDDEDYRRGVEQLKIPCDLEDFFAAWGSNPYNDGGEE